MGTPPPLSWRKPSHVSAKRIGGDDCDSGGDAGDDGGVSLRFPLGLEGKGRVFLLWARVRKGAVLE